MTNSQRIQLKMSEVRQAINGFDTDNGVTAELDKLTAEHQRLESQYRAAMITESTEDTAHHSTEDTAEGREIGRLLTRASILDFVGEAVSGATLDGASKELREAVLGSDIGGFMPLDMLLPRQRVEQRADAVSNVATAIQENQMPIAGRVFPRSSAEYLGVNSPTVAVGTLTYPRITAGTSADVRNPGVELDGAAATLSTESINPVRLTASYSFGMETLSKVSGYEEALREDMRGTFENKRDYLVINGQAAVQDTSPAVAGIISALTEPTDPTAVAIWSDYLGSYDSMVDGKYAMSAEQVRLLVNAACHKQAMALPVGTNGNAGLLRDRLPAERFRVSANMPDVADKFATAISYAAGTPALGMFMPTWAGVEMIVDPYTKAKAGQKIMTAVMVVGFEMVDSAAYSRLAFQVEA